MALAAVLLTAGAGARAAGPGGPGSPGGPGGADGKGSSWGLGIGAISMQKPYKGMDRETKALPMLSYENRWVKVFGPGLMVKLPSATLSPTQRIDFGLVAKWSPGGYEADDAPILNGMAERKGGIWVGGKATWQGELAELGAEWTTDASGHSKGQRLALTLERSWRFGPSVMLTPRLGANWLDKKYVDYYYGVRANEVAANRAAYRGRSAFNPEIGLRGMYMFNRQHSMFVDVGVTSLASSIKDSPLVDASTENRVFIGYLYRF
ncbi:MipA/OmpV family protein [Mitsuaria sp. GD03876]|uniref:MipA/OmpV family protein n=1 Tax=Mitsuaria sp. GD03876 TaxID=2975399 RepID=UPI00244CF85A|nr:MipA/OmpV family protein [Mitsuaria sp. GD03876]MDH0864699.1 MipA/OmpV family protein [Mitsuaria sp. GD03876]